MKIFYLEKFEGFYSWEKRKISWVPDTQNSIRLEIVKLRPVCLAPDLLKDTNCQKICSSLRRPETVQEIRKKVIFLEKINKLIICNFFKDFTNHRKKTKKVVVFNCRSLSNIPKYRNHIRNLPTIWKTRLLQTHIK